MLSKLFQLIHSKSLELNALLKNQHSQYIYENILLFQYGEICKNIENFIRMIIQSGPRHQVKDKMLGLYDEDIVNTLFKNAKSVKSKTVLYFIDSLYSKEPCKKAWFDKDHMPELKTEDWWIKEYSVAKLVGQDKKDVLVEKFKVVITKMSMKYIPRSKELLLTIRWDAYKWVDLGGKASWSPVG